MSKRPTLSAETVKAQVDEIEPHDHKLPEGAQGWSAAARRKRSPPAERVSRANWLVTWLQSSQASPGVEPRQTGLDHKLPEGAQGWRSAAARRKQSPPAERVSRANWLVTWLQSSQASPVRSNVELRQPKRLNAWVETTSGV